MLVCLDLWSGEAFSSAASGYSRASLSFSDESACPNVAFCTTRSAVTICSRFCSIPRPSGSQCSSFWALSMCSTVSVCFSYMLVSKGQRMCFVYRVIAPCIHDTASYYRCNTCKITLFSAIFVIIFLAKAYIVGLSVQKWNICLHRLVTLHDSQLM